MDWKILLTDMLEIRKRLFKNFDVEKCFEVNVIQFLAPKSIFHLRVFLFYSFLLFARNFSLFSHLKTVRYFKFMTQNEFYDIWPENFHPYPT